MHDLVPHKWLWKGSEFRWKQVPTSRASSRRRRADDRWEREFGDLHARALEAWAHTRALSRVDETERGKVARLPRRTDQLLRHLEARFWPERQDGLAARHLLKAEPSLVDRMGSLAVRSLAFDPANFRLLHAADRYLSVDGRGAAKKREVFVEAIGQRDVAPPLLVWLGDRLDELEDYRCALDAYGGAARGRRAEVDKATVLLGKARALWGDHRYDEALASLALVPSNNGMGEWRLRFVETLVQRGQVRKRIHAAPEAASPTSGSRLATLAAIPTLRRARRGGPSDGYEDGVVPLLEAEVHDRDGCESLVSWLEVEHGASIAAGDLAGAADAAEALLRVTAERYTENAPNRTTPLPDVSASTGDAGLDRESYVVPLIRRLALEVHTSVILDREERFWELVGQDIPEVQRRIVDATGVPVPLPSYLRNDHLPPGGFRVLVNELPVRRGRIGEDGSYEPIVAAVREAIENNLKALVGVDEMVVALRAMAADEKDLAAKFLEDDIATIQLLKAVRKLTGRRMRVSLGTLLHDLVQDDSANIDTFVDAVRARRRLESRDNRAERAVEARRQGPSWAVDP